MNKYIYYFFLFFLFWNSPLQAQLETECNPAENFVVAEAEFNYNFGSTTNALTALNKTSYIIGQPAVGMGFSQDVTYELGYWATFLLPPQAPAVEASQGDFPDRVIISWKLDPLSSAATDGYIVLRNDAYLATIDPGVTQYNDFNIQAGEFYEYQVYGQNQFGDGVPAYATGFVNPNGIITGKITTTNGNPVPNATVTLSPTIGTSLEFDGLSNNICFSYHEDLPIEAFTVSTWVKPAAFSETPRTGTIIDFGSTADHTDQANFALIMQEESSYSEVKGLFHLDDDSNNSSEVVGTVMDDSETTENEAILRAQWTHIAMTYSNGKAIIYINGQFAGAADVAKRDIPSYFTIGSTIDQEDFFKGKIDDVRIYNKMLSQTEILTTKDITASESTDGLVGYWKFDEGFGVKTFDIASAENPGFLNGPSFSDDTPDLLNGGITNAGGFYIVEGVNYSSEQSFTARPSKVFYGNYSLEFNAATEGLAVLSDFDLPDSSSTIEIVVQPFDTESEQAILSNGTDNFRLYVHNGFYHLIINGEDLQVMPAANNEGLIHLAFALNGDTDDVTVYKNGQLEIVLPYSDLSGDWSGNNWVLGADGDLLPEHYFTGLIDEVAFYKNDLLVEDIQLHAATTAGGGTDTGHGDLMVYFGLNEGEGEEVEDFGAFMTGRGQVVNAIWSILGRRQETTVHEFQPNLQIININSSNTAMGNIDFTDLSTVPVSGVVRFANTFCYADSIEILVDGASAFPPIFTDENGYFVADLEPGSSVRLSPSFADHEFLPEFFEVQRANTPIAGVLFQDLTTRSITGQLYGGYDCRASIVPQDAVINETVKVELQSSDNSCFRKVITINNTDGTFEFSDIPPIRYTVSVLSHPHSDIPQSLESGAQLLNMREVETEIAEFVYIAPPEIEFEGFDLIEDCMFVVLEQTHTYKPTIKVYEDYYGEKCYLDTVTIEINNGMADDEMVDTLITEGVFEYEFTAGSPVLSDPYEQIMSITATTKDEAMVTHNETAKVAGRRARANTFQSTSPSIPFLILHDPPGDGSYSYLSEEATTCFGMGVDINGGVEATQSLSLKFGPDVAISTGVGVEKISEFDVTNDYSLSTTLSYTTGFSTTAEVCVTNTELFQTSSADDIVGAQGGDLFAGAAINIQYGIMDILSYDTENCQMVLDEEITVNPEGFESTFIYTEHHIANVVIPELINDLQDLESAEAWQSILDQNNANKADATYDQTISFSAGTVYEQSQTTAIAASLSMEWSATTVLEWAASVGFEADGIGSVTEAKNKITLGFSQNFDVSSNDSRTTGYVLSDDDANDNFAVNVKKDKVYGTPVFEVISGESMCPWEPNTSNREEVELVLDPLAVANVSSNSSATFDVTLSNISPTEQTMNYKLEDVIESNPDGAGINIIGVGSQEIQLGAFESQMFTMTVNRGPVEYDYPNLQIAAYSKCEYDRTSGLGDAPGTTAVIPLNGFASANGEAYVEDDRFYKVKTFDVYFTEPCSEIEMAAPVNDVVTNDADPNEAGEQNDDIVTITLNDYDKNDTDFLYVQVQFRNSSGSGTWINLGDDIAREDLGEISETVTWDTDGLSDGVYELRALTICNDPTLEAGISTTREVKIERQLPQVFGTPQPADGILHQGDEISIEFTKRIDCDQIHLAEFINNAINNNNVGLYDMSMGTLVGTTITCSDYKIVINPTDLAAYENKTLRVQVEGILDLVGNAMEDAEIWEFYVNQSNLYWENSSIQETMEEGTSLTVTREIKNQGSSTTGFSIEDIPNWMEISPNSGELQPGESKIITFTFDENLISGQYNETLQLSAGSEDEPLTIDLRVICAGPIWGFDATQYTYSMTMTLQLDIEGNISEDERDRVGAFVDDELRGWAYVEQEPAITSNEYPDGAYLAFLTIYSDNFSGEDIQLKIWDVSDCTLYGEVAEDFTFEADEVVGSPIVPQVVHTVNLVARTIPIHEGWNWISYNVSITDASINNVLASLTQPSGNLIKGQEDFAHYSDAMSSWTGSLTELSHLTMYQYRSEMVDSLLLVGMPIDPESVQIDIVAGWNWLGFLPQQGMSVTDALSTLTPLDGDIIKSQSGFAQFVSGAGWIGNLDFMSSPNGYLLNISNAGILIYPSNFRTEEVDFRNPSYTPYWTIQPELYQYNMNVIGMVVDETSLLEDGDEVAAFIGNEIRGHGTTVYLETFDEYLIFLTAYSNGEGEEMSFRFYDRSEEEEVQLAEQFVFIPNALYGEVDNPIVWTPALSSSASELVTHQDFVIYPNPANERIYLLFYNEKAERIQIRIRDALGREVDNLTVDAPAGELTLEWSPKELSDGVYFISLEKAEQVVTRKVTIRR